MVNNGQQYLVQIEFIVERCLILPFVFVNCL